MFISERFSTATGGKEETRTIEKIVEQLGFRAVGLFHGGQTTLGLEQLEHQAGDVDRRRSAACCTSVVVGVRLVVEHGRRAVDGFADQVFTHDDDGQPGRADLAHLR